MAVADIDQDGREGQGQQKPVRTEFRKPRWSWNGRSNNRADRQEIKAKRDRLPYGKRDPIRHQRECGGDKQKEWRIVPAVERRRFPENLLLARVLPGGIEWRLGVAVQYIGAGCVDIGEVRSQRPSLLVNEPMRGHDQIEKAGHGCDEDHGRYEPDTLARKPGAAAQKLPCPTHGGSSISDGCPAH